MIRKLKFAIAALLGFSAACSALKPSVAADSEAGVRESDSVRLHRPIRVMYGVRRPIPLEQVPVDTSRQSMALQQQPQQTPPPAQQSEEPEE